MTVLSLLTRTEGIAIPESHFIVVHPLDDVPEKKVDTTTLGLMPMTRTVKRSLVALRGYLILMMLLVLYHVADLSGLLSKHAH